MKKSLLLIEDDLEIGELISEFLQQHHFHVSHQLTVVSGLAYLTDKQHEVDAIILDLMLPDGDGLSVCQNIRSMSGDQAKLASTPIIMLTAKGDAMDRIIGLELGADDYLPKPFEPRELLARLKSILRRQQPILSGTHAAAENTLTFGSLSIHPNTRTISLDGENCDITGYQFDILHTLAKRAGNITSRDVLMNELKQQDLDVFDRSIDVHISRIRAAIETDSKHPKRIITVRGAGYLFAAEQD